MKNIITSTAMKGNKLLLLLLFTGVFTAFTIKSSSVNELVPELQRNAAGKSIALFGVIPNDCVSCLYNFHAQLKKMQALPNTQPVLVFRNRRQVEKAALLKDEFADVDTTKTIVIWNDALYNDIMSKGSTASKGSLLLVYDKAGKPVLCKRVKEITGVEKELGELR